MNPKITVNVNTPESAEKSAPRARSSWPAGSPLAKAEEARLAAGGAVEKASPDVAATQVADRETAVDGLTALFASRQILDAAQAPKAPAEAAQKATGEQADTLAQFYAQVRRTVAIGALRNRG